jgi:uncharacterized membrane protein
MSKRLRLIARTALFSALIYVLSWATVSLPNVNLVFFVIFAAGFLWGGVVGAAVGIVGMGLWTTFNPYGPALPPIIVAQLIGASASGLIGAWFHRSYHPGGHRWALAGKLAMAAVACTVLYYLPVNAADAWLFRPFWPRFLTGLGWVGISLVSNIIVFPLLFRAVEYLYARERAYR